MLHKVADHAPTAVSAAFYHLLAVLVPAVFRFVFSAHFSRRRRSLPLARCLQVRILPRYDLVTLT